VLSIVHGFHVELLKDYEKILLKNELVLWGDYRPRVSNDNPYAESLFRTLKYRPAWPNKGFAIPS
jgi:hypothetical protein